MPSDGSVSVQEMTSAYAVINVIGPKSRELLQKLTNADVGNEGFAFGTCRNFAIGYAPIMSFRITYVGELGYELYIPTEFAVHVYESLWEAGQDLGIKNAGYRTIASMHLEKGYGYGHTIGKNICYGYISVADASHDEGYEIEVYKEVYPAKLEPSRVLYDPEREKILR
jgi:glycine cleavage system aminomethyltransferase T